MNQKAVKVEGLSTQEPWMKNGGHMSTIRINKAEYKSKYIENQKLHPLPKQKRQTKKSLKLLAG